MEYRKDKRTKNLTLCDIHVGDWVQVWSEIPERYSPPMKITQICDDGTVYLIDCEENRLDPHEEDIKDIDALPIDGDLLRGFGFDVSNIDTDRGQKYQNVDFQGKYIGQIRYDHASYLILCGYVVEYMHEFIQYNHRNHIDIKLEWKGILK